MKFKVTQQKCLNLFWFLLLLGLSIWSIPQTSPKTVVGVIGVTMIIIDSLIILFMTGVIIISIYDGDIQLFKDFEVTLFSKKEYKNINDLNSKMLEAERRGEKAKADMIHNQIREILRN